MKRDLIAAAFALSLFFISPATLNAQKVEQRSLTPEESFSEIKKAAMELVKSDPPTVRKPVFEYNDREKLLEYNLGGVQVGSFELDEDDPYHLIFEKQIQIEALRDLYNRRASEDGFWEPALSLSEQLILDTLRDVESASDKAALRTKVESREKHFDSVLGFLHQSIRLFAQSKGYTAKRVGDRGGAIASDSFIVQIVKEPANGTVRVLPWAKYVKCRNLKLCGDQWPWRELVSESENMIGQYFYQAEWVGGRSNEGNFEVRNSTTITFRPKE